MNEPPPDDDEHARDGDGDASTNGAGPHDEGERRSRVAKAAGRLAFSPVRAAARVARKPLEDVADEVLSAPEMARIIDRMLAGSLPEDIVESLTRHQVLERVAAGLDDSGEIERLVTAALESPRTLTIVDGAVESLLDSQMPERVATQVAESGEIERLVGTALQSPRTLTMIDGAVETLLDNRVPERVAAQVADSGEIERLVTAALQSPRTLQLTDNVVESIIASKVADRIAARVVESGEIERLVTAALESPRTLTMIDGAVDSLLDSRVPERIASRVAASGEIERLVGAALESPRALQLTDQLLASDVAHHTLREIATSPEVTAAITQQTTGFFEVVAGGVRSVAVRFDDRVERLVRRRPRSEPAASGGIVTRAVALSVDALATLVLYMSVVGMATLITSLVGEMQPDWLVATLLATAWAIISSTYFVLFWLSAGQTPGMRLMRLRVQRVGGGSLSFSRSVLRLVGLVLSIIPLFAGFIPVLFTTRRRGLADFMARTVVVYEDADEDEDAAAA
jgi:uncharacterized RDD family membrane protein YckC